MINKILPFPIQFHFLFWLLFAGAVITGQFQQLLMLFAIVFMHELGHVVTANYFGWRITRLTILPFGGVVEMDSPGKEDAREEFWIAIAGPIVNGILMVLVLFLYGLTLISWELTLFCVVGNATIALFNLLPIYPLDGGRIFQILLSLRFPFRFAILLSLYTGLFFIFLLLLLSFKIISIGIHAWFVLLYLSIMIILELRRLPYRFMTFLLSRHTKMRSNMLRTEYVTVGMDQTLKLATNKMYRHRYHLFKLRRDRSSNPKYQYFGEQRVLSEMFDQKRPLATFADIED